MGIKEKVLTLKDLQEGGTSRLYKHITEDDNLAIISSYVSNEEEPADKLAREGKSALQSLKSEVRKTYNLGFSHLISRWVDPDGTPYDEEALLIYGISYDDAMALGAKYNQKSIIVKDDKGCREVVSTAFVDDSGKQYKVGDTIRTFNLSGDTPLNIATATDIFSKKQSGPSSSPVKQNRPFTLKEVYEVEPPRPSYFQTSYSVEKIFENKELRETLTVNEALKLLKNEW